MVLRPALHEEVPLPEEEGILRSEEGYVSQWQDEAPAVWWQDVLLLLARMACPGLSLLRK